MSPLMHLLLFAAKSVIVLVVIVLILVVFFALISKGKDKQKGKLTIKNINKQYAETKEQIYEETLNKKAFKSFLKTQKAEQKAAESETKKNIYVLTFNGDIKASAVCALSKEISAVLNVATPQDEVIIRVESPGGVVHGYGLAAAQLMRIRQRHIPLTICIDKVAASGGYLMACIGNKILSAPFAIIGSIGVIVQIPNFNRVLKDKHIEFEQLTAGDYKRTLTLFGENTPEGKEKLQEEIEVVHEQFKNLISEYRQQVDINQVATGEHWLGQQALHLKLVDEIKTSDDYILECTKYAHVYELCYETKKAFLSKLTSQASAFALRAMARQVRL